MWIYTSTPPYSFMAQCLIRGAQGQLYLFRLKSINVIERSGSDCKYVEIFTHSIGSIIIIIKH
jgi:hypothetical protein